MALLTATAHNVQLAPVMSSNSWKRPWTDFDGGSGAAAAASAAAAHASPTPQSSLTLPSPRTDRQAQDIPFDYHKWRSGVGLDGTTGTKTSHSSSPWAPSPSDEHQKRQASAHWTVHGGYPPASSSNKRPRYDGPTPPSPYAGTPAQAPRDDAAVAPVAPADRRQVYGPYDGLNASSSSLQVGRHGKESAVENPFVGVGGAGGGGGSGAAAGSQVDPGAAVHGNTVGMGPVSPPRSRTQLEKSISTGQMKATTCQTCKYTLVVAPRLAKGLAKLHVDLSTMWSSSTALSAEKDLSTQQDAWSNYLPGGITDSLDWSLNKLNDSIDLARNMLGSSAHNQEQDRHHHQSKSFDMMTVKYKMQEQAEGREDSATVDIYRRQQQQQQQQRRSPASEDGSNRDVLPPILRGDERHRPTPLATQSPFGHSQQQQQHQPQSSAQSPIHSGPNQPRSSIPPLPSPSSLSYTPTPASTVLPPMSPSLTSHPTTATSTTPIPPPSSGNPQQQPPTTTATPSAGATAAGTPRSPHTTHLQDLQHQISTKSLALTILQSEHEKLLSAYHRQQTRCAALDRKSEVSDAEISTLAEERIRLQCELDAANESAAELGERLDEVRGRAEAEKGQWGIILRKAGELERGTVKEGKRARVREREWGRVRRGLARKVRELEGRLGVEFSVEDEPEPEGGEGDYYGEEGDGEGEQQGFLAVSSAAAAAGLPSPSSAAPIKLEPGQPSLQPPPQQLSPHQHLTPTFTTINAFPVPQLQHQQSKSQSPTSSSSFAIDFPLPPSSSPINPAPTTTTTASTSVELGTLREQLRECQAEKERAQELVRLFVEQVGELKGALGAVRGVERRLGEVVGGVVV